MAKRFCACLVVCLALLTGCSAGSKEKIGMAAGALVGAAVVIATGNADNAGAAAVGVGAFIGAAIGSIVGGVLDEADRKAATAAMVNAAAKPVGQRTDWLSNENPGVYGYAQSVTPPKSEQSGLCREVKNVFWVDGKEQSETAKLCLTGGRWAIV